MEKTIKKLLILLPYCIPFGYLAMAQDYNSGSMILYAFMVLAFAILLNIGLRIDGGIVIIIGNIISGISSYAFILNKYEEGWSYYFKPFSPEGLLIFITAIGLLVQLFIIYRSNKGR